MYANIAERILSGSHSYQYLFVGTALTCRPNSVNLAVNSNATPFASVAATANDCSVANALETANQKRDVLKRVLLASSAAVPQTSFHQLGEIYPVAYGMLINESRDLIGVVRLSGRLHKMAR